MTLSETESSSSWITGTGLEPAASAPWDGPLPEGIGTITIHASSIVGSVATSEGVGSS